MSGWLVLTSIVAGVVVYAGIGFCFAVSDKRAYPNDSDAGLGWLFLLWPCAAIVAAGVAAHQGLLAAVTKTAARTPRRLSADAARRRVAELERELGIEDAE